MSSLLTYALNAENQLMHIDKVPNGKACNCTCPYCQKELMAKNGGEIREHHFAHLNNQECKGAYESALHLLAKDIIEKEGGIMLPPYLGPGFPTGFVKLDNVEIEKWDSTYNIKPDAQGILPDGRRLLVEFLVTHKVVGEKYNIITSNNLLCIEIDIKHEELDRDALKSYLIEEREGRKWICKTEVKTESDSLSLPYSRNPNFDVLAHFLKDKFETDTIIIKGSPSIYRAYPQFNLKEYDYDICETNESYRNFKCNLLLYRSSKPGKGHIAINIRGRHRNYDFKPPKGLRLIDIIVKRSETEESVKRRFENGTIINDDNLVRFLGAWKDTVTRY